MATLQKIRDRGVLIAIAIGIALLAFLLTDFLNNGSSRGTRNIGEIAGESISFEVFSTKYQKALENTRQNTGNSSVDDNTQLRIRNQIWEQLVRSYVMEEEYEDIGIAVSDEELGDMVQGENIHPTVRQLFANPQTGQVDRAQMHQVLKSIVEGDDIGRKMQWKQIEEELKNQRKFEKYMNLIRKGLYVTSQQAKNKFFNENNKVSFSFITQNYAEIPDSSISIPDKKIEDYYKFHIDEYQQEASRDIEYVAFDIRASDDDDKATKEDINELKEDFENEDDVIQFVNLESDTQFDTKYYKEGEHSSIINENLFNGKKGDSFGPFFENGTYKLAKIADVKYLPDSVNARHILIKPKEQTPEAFEEAKALADSLENLINNGQNFAMLAMQYSEDPGSKLKGGDLGWFQEGQMVPSFNDACFFGNIGDIISVESQFGIHIIEVLKHGKKQKKIQVAIIERKVNPSEETIKKIYNKASKFAGLNNTAEKFDAAAEEQGFRKVSANNIKEADRYISGLESPRALVFWTFNKDRKENDLTEEIFTFGDKFVVACLKKIKEKGNKSLEDVKYEIEVILRKEKKGEIIAEKINSLLKEGKSFEEIASSLETEIKTAENLNFISNTLLDTGDEPKVAATAWSMEKDEMSEPISGNLGVYLVKVNSKSEVEATDFNLEKNDLTNTLSSRVYREAFEALKENADIEDNRAKFY